MKSLFIAFVCLSSVYFFVSCDKENDSPPEQRKDTPDYDFPVGKVYFSYPPIPMQSIQVLEPRGYLDPPPSPHGGVHHIDFGKDESNIPVYALTDGLVLGMDHNGYDYSVVVQYSTTINVTFGHLGGFYGPLAKRFGDSTNIIMDQVWIPVKAGDTLGFVNPKAAIDWNVTDTSQTLNFIYPMDYGPEARHSALVTDFYQEPLKNQLIAKSVRKTPPYMGKTDYDVSGTMMGNWFLEGNNRHFQNAFTFGYNHIFADRLQIRDGYFQHRENPDGNKIFAAILKNNRPRPDTLGPEHGMIKFEVLRFGHGYNFDPVTKAFTIVDTTNIDQRPTDGVFLLQMLGPEKLKVESFEGKTAAQVSGFTEAARIYNRKQELAE